MWSVPYYLTYQNVNDIGTNQLLSTTGPAPAKENTYDEAGNLLTDGTVTYTYSARGRMNSAKKGLNKVSYLYNGMGLRVKKTGPAGVIATGSNLYVYDEESRLLGEYDATGHVIQETVYIGDMPVATLRQSVVSGMTVTQPYYIYADHINTPRVITRASDNKIVWCVFWRT